MTARPFLARVTLGAFGRTELAPITAVKDVDDESDREPNDEANPCDQREAGHQPAAKHDGDDGKERNEWNLEAARTLRLAAAQKDYAEGHENEGEQGADIR